MATIAHPLTVTPPGDVPIKLFCPPCEPTNGTAEGDGVEASATAGVAGTGMGTIDDPLTVIPPGVVPVGDGAVTAVGEPLTTNPFGAFVGTEPPPVVVVGMAAGGTLDDTPVMIAEATAGLTVLVNESDCPPGVEPALFPPLTTI